jgi:DtxR family Mn-dependent transcriptional regulator
MPTSTVEDYLKAILLEGEKRPGVLISMGRIATALSVSPGTVTSMVKTLSRSGLVSYEPYSGVELTGAGRELATHVLRRHRLIELFLVQVLGLDWSEVHDEAELLEHAVSDRVIDQMDEMLGRPSVDPHGDPIPDASGRYEEPAAASLLGCPLGQELKVVRITDQSPEFLQLAEREGFMPGCRLTVDSRSEAADTVVVATGDGERTSLGLRAASKIQVRGGGD